MPQPESLDLRSLNVANGPVVVRVEWPAGLGSATLTRVIGGATTSLAVAGPVYFDPAGATGPIAYRVTAGSRTFEGTATPLAAPDCTIGGVGGSGPPEDGPPECDWRTASPGATPFSICFRSVPVPVLTGDAEFAWSDVASRAGYLVEFGPVQLNCANAPPFTYTGRPVALTDGKSLRFGQGPIIGTSLADSRFLGLLANANLGLTGWPQVQQGSLYGWKIRPVTASSDGRNFAVGRAHMLPRVYKAQ